MSQLTEFYKGAGRDSEGRSIAMIWAYSHAQWEASHDFIQWLFPLRLPSRFNPDAPRLTEVDVAEFTPALRFVTTSDAPLRSFSTSWVCVKSKAGSSRRTNSIDKGFSRVPTITG